MRSEEWAGGGRSRAGRRREGAGAEWMGENVATCSLRCSRSRDAFDEMQLTLLAHGTARSRGKRERVRDGRARAGHAALDGVRLGFADFRRPGSRRGLAAALEWRSSK